MTYATEVLADSPLGYWKFEETSGTSAFDASGNSRNGSIVGTPSLNQTTVMASGTGSYLLNTTSRRVSIPNGTWQNVSAFTCEAWINLSSSTSYHAIMVRDGNSANRGWNFYVKDARLNALDAGDSGTNHQAATNLSLSTDYHAVLTFDGTTLKMYLNGVLDGTFTMGFSCPSTQPITIGASAAGTSSFAFSLDGRINHVAYYGSALSATRIAAHYTAGSSTALPAITGTWGLVS